MEGTCAVQKCKIKLVEERGYIIDYGSLWCGRLSADKQTLVTGYRVFTKDRQFSGLLSEDKAVLWDVDMLTLYLDGGKQPKDDSVVKGDNEYEKLIFMYTGRYAESLNSALNGLDAYSLRECPKIIAEFHTIERLQQIFPAIIFTEDKVEGLRKIWTACDYREIFANCCGSPIVSYLRKEVVDLLEVCRKIIYKDVPWAMTLLE